MAFKDIAVKAIDVLFYGLFVLSKIIIKFCYAKVIMVCNLGNAKINKKS